MSGLMTLSMSIKYLLFAIAIFISNIVQALTGFAGVMLSIPPSILLFGPDTAIAVVNALVWGVSLVLAWKNRNYLDKKIILFIISFMLLGMAIGVKLYTMVDAHIIAPIYGAIIVAAALKNIPTNLCPTGSPPVFLLAQVLFTVCLHPAVHSS